MSGHCSMKAHCIARLIQWGGFHASRRLKPARALVFLSSLAIFACGDMLGVDFDVEPEQRSSAAEGAGVTSGGGEHSSSSTTSGETAYTIAGGGSGTGGAADANAATDTGGSGSASALDGGASSTDSGPTGSDGGGGEAGSFDAAGGGGGEAGSSGRDPPPMRRCRSKAPFSAVRAVSGISGAAALAHYAHDELTVYYAAITGSVTNVVMATRSTVDDAFGPAEPVPALNQSGFVASPSLTADGLTVYLESAATGRFRIYTASRNAPDESFSVPTMVSEIVANEAVEGGPFVSVSGDELYFHSTRNGNSKLFRATRSEYGFQVVEELAVSSDDFEESFPAVSPDNLALYFVRRRILPTPESNTVLWRAIRSDVEDNFADPEPVTELDSPAAAEIPDWISMDNCRLYFSRMPVDDLWPGSSLVVATREPEEL